MASSHQITDGIARIALREELLSEAVVPNCYCAIGKLYTRRVVRITTLRSNMHRFWGLKQGLEAREVGDKLYVFLFEDRSEMMKVVRQQPWQHNNSLLLIQEFNGLVSPELVQFQYCPITVRIYGLPMAFMTEKIIKVVGSAVGQVMEVEVDHGGRAWGSFVRFKAKFDTLKPLVRSVLITLPTGEVELQFKYERLPDFCFVCGSLLHLETECEDAIKMKEEQGMVTRLFGPGLRAEIDGALARFMASRSVQGQALMVPGAMTSSGQQQGSTIAPGAVTSVMEGVHNQASRTEEEVIHGNKKEDSSDNRPQKINK